MPLLRALGHERLVLVRVVGEEVGVAGQPEALRRLPVALGRGARVVPALPEGRVHVPPGADGARGHADVHRRRRLQHLHPVVHAVPQPERVAAVHHDQVRVPGRQCVLALDGRAVRVRHRRVLHGRVRQVQRDGVALLGPAQEVHDAVPLLLAVAPRALALDAGRAPGGRAERVARRRDVGQAHRLATRALFHGSFQQRARPRLREHAVAERREQERVARRGAADRRAPRELDLPPRRGGVERARAGEEHAEHAAEHGLRSVVVLQSRAVQPSVHKRQLSVQKNRYHRQSRGRVLRQRPEPRRSCTAGADLAVLQEISRTSCPLAALSKARYSSRTSCEAAAPARASLRLAAVAPSKKLAIEPPVTCSAGRRRRGIF
mmetsp:Transcript_15400/g.45998  ORF Transcript_15400/g.45998 Transcript_15400/m.45998 type:complete len:377 (+) Transcript_15400:84-1214(+)